MADITTTMLPPPSSAELARVPDHDEAVNWRAIERQGVEWRRTRERETARPGRP